jgi:hypothetical protein
MALTLPLTISPEAREYVARVGMQGPLQKMLDNIPARMSNVRAIQVLLQDSYDLGGGPCVILDVTRDRPDVEYDDTDWNWRRWVAETFPPDELQHFCLVSNHGAGDAATLDAIDIDSARRASAITAIRKAFP